MRRLIIIIGTTGHSENIIAFAASKLTYPTEAKTINVLYIYDGILPSYIKRITYLLTYLITYLLLAANKSARLWHVAVTCLSRI